MPPAKLDRQIPGFELLPPTLLEPPFRFLDQLGGGRFGEFRSRGSHLAGQHLDDLVDEGPTERAAELD